MDQEHSSPTRRNCSVITAARSNRPIRMILAALLSLLSGFSLSARSPHAQPEPSPEEYGVKVTINVTVPMRDGVNLSADIYRPGAPGPFPCLLLRTYWGSSLGPLKVPWAMYFASRGYAVALVDVRGRYDSEGEWEPYVNEPRDGYDTQQWLGQQDWCDGSVGTFGRSYDGFTALMSAPLQSPYLKCMVPAANQQTNFGHLYNDGVLQLGVIFNAGIFISGRTLQPSEPRFADGEVTINYQEVYHRLPLNTALDDLAWNTHYKEWLRHPTYDEYWKSYGMKEKYPEVTVPAYFLTGWYDNLVHEGFRNFLGIREQGGSETARRGTRILVGPWAHGSYRTETGQTVTFGNGLDLRETHLRWYDYWLKDIQNGIDKEAPIRIFVMRADQWRDEFEWPLARTRWTPYYLDSGGGANSLFGDGVLRLQPPARPEGHDSYLYNPLNPVPTMGGQISVESDLKGPKNRRAVQRRDDILVYTSPAMERDVEVTGPVELRLHAASSAVDTDFTATLTDVYPDGRAIHICEGIQRASFRDSLENPSPIEPEKVYEYRVSLWETSYVFKSGHRIRLEVSSSNFPRYARNLNTGHPLGTSSETRTARQIIHHSSRYPSQLILPVIPSGRRK